MRPREEIEDEVRDGRQKFHNKAAIELLLDIRDAVTKLAEITYTPTEEPEESVEEAPKVNNKLYKNILINISGIGSKTAEDIMIAYPTLPDLKEAIANGEKLSVRDDVERKLKKEL